MIKNHTLTHTLLFLLFISPFAATGEEHLSEDQRLFFFAPKITTFKNVCDDTELISFEAFMPKNMFLYFKQQTNNGIIQDYNKYMAALAQHQKVMIDYINNLTQKMQTYTPESMTNYQTDYIRVKIHRLTAYLNKLLKEAFPGIHDYEFYNGTMVMPFSDSFGAFDENSTTFDELNDNFLFNLHKMIAEAGQIDAIRNALQPAVCGNIIGTIVDVFTAYLDEENFNQLSQEKRVLLVNFFNEFSKSSFEAYECGGQGKQAKTHLINQIYKTIYNKDLDEFNPSEFQYFLDKIIPNTPTTSTTDFSSIRKMDHDIVHTFEKFNTLSLDDLRTMHRLRKPISIDFIRFINDAENQFSEMDVSVNNKANDDLPLETFLVIYKAYIIGRSDLPEDQQKLLIPIDGVEAQGDLPHIAKRLYSFILQTDLFDPIPADEENPEVLIAKRNKYGQLMDPIKFQQYRLLALIALARMFNMNPMEVTQNNIPQLNNILDQYVDPSEFVDSGDLSKYMPPQVIQKYHNQQAKAIFDNFDKKKDEIRDLLKNKLKNPKGKKPKKEVLSEVFQSAEPEIEDIVNFTNISNPKENIKTLAVKANLLTSMVENATDEVDQFSALNVIARALHTKVLKNIEDGPGVAEKKKLLTVTLVKMNDKLINDLLLKIRTPGLYQFLTYISTQANLNDTKVLGRNQKFSSDPDRANNFTLDKLIFLHRWYDVSKKSVLVKQQQGVNLDKNDLAITKLVGPSRHLKESLSMHYNNQGSNGVSNVYKHLLMTSMFLEYYPSLKFMAELIPLFERFSAIEHENPTERIHENYKEMFITLYNIILDIRSDDYEIQGRSTVTVFLERLHLIRHELLEAHMSRKNEQKLTARHSMTYKDVARVSYFVYYHLSMDMEVQGLLEEQIAGNFGVNDLIEKDKVIIQQKNPMIDAEQYLHQRFDFGGIAFEMSNFLTYIYLHDRNYIRNVCVNLQTEEDESSIKLNGFCAQAMIFLNSMEFLSGSTGGDFSLWMDTVFGDEIFKQYVIANKGIFFAALEMINRESNMLRTLHTERLSKLIDDEQARVINLQELRQNGDQIAKTDYESFFMLDAKDKSWLVNYMFVNFERVYNKHEEALFAAFADIVKNDHLDDYIGPIKKIHYNDLELEAKSFNVEAFRVLLLFTQTFDEFAKIADYVMNHNRSQLLIYLKKENDGQSNVINTLLDRVANEGQPDLNRVKEIIKEFFNQYNDVLIQRCENSIQEELELDFLDDFGDMNDILGDSGQNHDNTFSIDVDQNGIDRIQSERESQELSNRAQTQMNMLKKGIGAQVNLLINTNAGNGNLVINSNFSESLSDNEESPTKIASKRQVDNIAIGNVLSSLITSSDGGNKKTKIVNSPSVNFLQKKKTLVKNLKSTYEKVDEKSFGSQMNSHRSNQNDDVEMKQDFLLI